MLEHASQSWQDCEAIKFYEKSRFGGAPIFYLADFPATWRQAVLSHRTSQGFQQAGMHRPVTGNHITAFQRFIA